MKNVLKKEHEKAFKTNGIMSDIEGKRNTRNDIWDEPVLLRDILPEVMADIRSRMAARKAAENRAAIGKKTHKNRQRWKPRRPPAEGTGRIISGGNQGGRRQAQEEHRPRSRDHRYW